MVNQKSLIIIILINPKLCYKHQLTGTYGYSIQTIDFIVDEIKKDSDNIIQNLKNNLIKK